MFERSDVTVPLVAYIILAVGWLLFYGIHSVLAVPRVKQWFMKLTGMTAGSYRLVYNAIAGLTLLVMVCYLAVLPAERLMNQNSVVQYIGLVLGLWGMFLVRLAFRKYSIKQFIGLEDEQHTELVVSGIQGRMRHPIYTGALLVFLGLLVYAPTIKHLISFLCLCAYLPVGIYLEEKKLLTQYGKAYDAYKKQVPALLPRLKL